MFQTSGSYAGAAITTKLFSIIQTAVINNINVEKYLNYVFENINKEPIENLLPYSENILKKNKIELKSLWRKLADQIKKIIIYYSNLKL